VIIHLSRITKQFAKLVPQLIRNTLKRNHCISIVRENLETQFLQRGNTDPLLPSLILRNPRNPRITPLLFSRSLFDSLHRDRKGRGILDSLRRSRRRRPFVCGLFRGESSIVSGAFLRYLSEPFHVPNPPIVIQR